MALVEIKCYFCGKIFLRAQYRVSRNQRNNKLNFCSRSCRSKYTSKLYSLKPPNRREWHPSIILKCDNCDFVCETEMSMMNHIDSKHLFQNIERKEINSTKRDCSLAGIEGIEDLFQLEVLDGEDIYACNVCDQGFDRENKIKKHILEYHEELVLEIEKDKEKEPEINDDSGDESFSN